MKQIIFILVALLVLISGCDDNSTGVENINAEIYDPYPLDDAAGISITTKLEWTCTTENGEPLSYNVYVGTDPYLDVYDRMFLNLSRSSCIVKRLDYNTTYYWMIEAGDGEYFKESDVWSFTTMQEIDGFVLVDGGTFEMGDQSSRSENDEEPVHEVNLSSFLIGKYEVTQEEFVTAMGRNPSCGFGVRNDLPVYNVTWFDAAEYCNTLSTMEGLTPCYNESDWSCNFSANGYRLPTEAEWEYAARGGVYWEDDFIYSGITEFILLPLFAIFDILYSGPEDVGSRFSNQLHIHDMSGNVWEWCNDWYSDVYYFSSPIENPTGPESGDYRVKRGGSWGYNAASCRVANRSQYIPTTQTPYVGFRVVREYQ